MGFLPTRILPSDLTAQDLPHGASQGRSRGWMQVRPLERVPLPAECSPCGAPQGPGWTGLPPALARPGRRQTRAPKCLRVGLYPHCWDFLVLHLSGQQNGGRTQGGLPGGAGPKLGSDGGARVRCSASHTLTHRDPMESLLPSRS